MKQDENSNTEDSNSINISRANIEELEEDSMEIEIANSDLIDTNNNPNDIFLIPMNVQILVHSV